MTENLVLLPQPRRCSLSDETVQWREATVSRDRTLPREGYRLRIGAAMVDLTASDDAGEAYGRATLRQLARLHDGRLPVGAIEDWPDLAVRAVMIDIARDKVPTIETLHGIIDRLAEWKVNQLQLYTEHTFAYADHEAVWRDASPLTADDIDALDAYCRERFVELVPNQNCLGHAERWLRHERYRSLALQPEGFTEYGQWRGPSTLDPRNPAALELVQSWLAELLPHFTSRRAHIGLDEPWELRAEQIDDYLAWVAQLRALPEVEGRELLMWGDILGARPELVARIPDGVTICEWGYDADYDFAAKAEVFAGARREFWTCPGTSSWLSILGRFTNMVGNCAHAVDAAIAHGGTGMLNTDWGDQGHLQYLPVSEPGFAYGAAVSWCLETNRDLDVAAALDRHCYADAAGELGRALVRLGDSHRELSAQVGNVASSTLHLYFPQLHIGRGPLAGVQPSEYEAIEAILDDVDGALDRARPGRADGDLVKAELRNSMALVRVLCRDAIARLAGDGSIASVPEATRTELARSLDPVIDAHRELWLARNRPGGLADSVAKLRTLRTAYLRA
ncbi:MAG TPA: family 20 glycosylhydrolase [Acidimicrobiia bacterium]|nr:family 20 glycosylhydrolase [Acidimicrobiia bacterium]